VRSAIPSSENCSRSYPLTAYKIHRSRSQQLARPTTVVGRVHSLSKTLRQTEISNSVLSTGVDPIQLPSTMLRNVEISNSRFSEQCLIMFTYSLQRSGILRSAIVSPRSVVVCVHLHPARSRNLDVSNHLASKQYWIILLTA